MIVFSENQMQMNMLTFFFFWCMVNGGLSLHGIAILPSKWDSFFVHLGLHFSDEKLKAHNV